MTFNRETNVTKDAIGDIEIVLFVPRVIDADNPQVGDLNVQIIISDGSIINKRFDLLDRLGDDATGQTHRSNLVSLRDYIKTRLANEVLPT